MKTFLFSCLLLATSLSLSAQEWAADYPTAQATAKEAGKNVVIVFSGSDWCAPCMKLDREIWQAEEFGAAAGADFVFYKADFPRRKANQLPEALAAQNNALAERYEVESFPLVVVVTPEGDVLGQTGYQKTTPTEYLALLKGFVQ